MIAGPFRLLSGLIPSCAVVAEGPIRAVTGVLWPEEEAWIAGAALGRRQGFAAGRILARQALSILDGPDGPIGTAPDRAPVWPAGFTGSITHSRRWAAAAVARTEDLRGIGIDVEDIARFHPGLDAQLFCGDEIERLDRLDPQARQIAAAAMFSAKEAFYKCQHPLTGARLGFHDAAVRLCPEAGSFVLRLLTPARPFAAGRAFRGRIGLADGMVAAAISLEPADHPESVGPGDDAVRPRQRTRSDTGSNCRG